MGLHRRGLVKSGCLWLVGWYGILNEEEERAFLFGWGDDVVRERGRKEREEEDGLFTC